MLSAFATGPDLPVRTDIDIDASYRRHRLRIITAITLGYGLSYTCRLAIDMVKKPLIDGGIFTPADLGTIGSALFYSYAAGKLINGFVADHTNPRWFFAIGLLLSALCNLAMGLTTTVWIAVLVWGLNGWFQSYGAPASVISLANWFSNNERGRYYGIWSTAHSIGEGLTFAGVAALVGLFGWRWGFWGAGAVVVVAAAASAMVMTDRPQTLGLPAVADWRRDYYAPRTSEDAAATPPPSKLSVQLSILRIPAVWIVALASALAYVTRYAITSWGMLYLQEARGYSALQAGSMLTASTLAGIVGALAFGWISDTCFAARRPPANLLFGLIQLAGLGLLFFGPTSTAAELVAFLLFGLGMTGIVTSVGGLFAIDICPKRVAGAALGMVGLFSYVGAAIQENVSGRLIDGHMTMVAGVRHYDFGPAIWFWVGSSVASMLLAATLWRTKLRD